MIPDLTFDRVLPHLICYIVDCDYIWIAELQRHLNAQKNRRPSDFTNAAEVRFEDCPMRPDLINHVESGSFAMLNVSTNQIDVMLPRIHALYRKNVTVAVIGESDLVEYSIALQAAGTVAVVTDIFGCDKLAAIINKAAALKPQVITGWQTRFVNRLPWQPAKARNFRR